mmetsp:Transcript_21276/g.47439  ORF Transcript_21276/g.47439 Transcript_21276/m.47439 type:complete len:82 (+) Transcript_21276:711-956(+)
MNKLNKELDSLNARLKDQNSSNENLENELKDVHRRKYEHETAWKEERAELERTLNDLKFRLAKLTAENEECFKKYTQITEN